MTAALTHIRATVRKARSWGTHAGVDIALDDPGGWTLLPDDTFCTVLARTLFSLSRGSPILLDLWEGTGQARKVAASLGARFEKSKRRSSTDWFSHYAVLELSTQEQVSQVITKLHLPIPIFARIPIKTSGSDALLADALLVEKGQKAYPQLIPRYRFVVLIEHFDDALQIFPGDGDVVAVASTVKKLAQDIGLRVEDCWSA